MSVASILSGLPAQLQLGLVPQVPPIPPPPYDQPFAQLYANLGDGVENIATQYTVPWAFFTPPYGISAISPLTLEIGVGQNGVYQISYSAVCQTSNNVGENLVEAGVFINSALYNPSVSSTQQPDYSHISPPPTGIVNYTLTNTCLVELSGGDTIELQLKSNNGGGQLLSVMGTGTGLASTRYAAVMSIVRVVRTQ